MRACFKPGDFVEIYRRTRTKKYGPRVKRLPLGMMGTVVNVPVEEYNKRRGCDMVVRLISGAVGAACSSEWRLVRPLAESAAEPTEQSVQA